jgi:DNA primase
MADNQVEQVKQKIEIVELIGERVNLKRAGQNFKGLCPFHSEKTPSFFVSPEMQMYKCFGCGESGDAFSFLQKFEGMTFPEALETLAKRAGVTLTRTYRSDEDQKRDRYLEILHLATEYYHYLLTGHAVGKRARIYLKDRGVSSESIKDYEIGYAAESWQGLQDFLVKKKKYKAEELLNVGMIISRQGGGYYDRFRGRIMFPQKTATGQVVGFSGRVLDPEAKEAKYINTPETSLYHKGELLYGLSVARSQIRKKDRVVIVEGELDVISSHQAGLKEVAAVKGSALTEGQIHVIRRLTHNLILSLDADEAGQEAIRRGIELSEPAGINLRVVQLVGGKDPDEIARGDREAWQKLVEKAVSVYQFYLDMAFKRFDGTTGVGQKQISQFLVPVFNKIENSVEQHFWVKELSQRLEVSEELIFKEMAKVRLGSSEKPEKKIPAETNRLGRSERLERYVLAALLHLGEEAGEQIKTLETDWFAEEYLQRLAAALIQAQKESGSSDVGVITKHLPEALGGLVKELYAEDGALFTATDTERLKIYKQARRDLIELSLRERMKRLNQEMVRADLPAGKQQKLQKEYQRAERELRGD